MPLIPFEKFEIESPLTIGELEESLRNHLFWNTDLGITSSTNSFRDYEGFVNKDMFKIRRILKYGRNSFIPIATGMISENRTGGSHIEIKVSLHKIVLVLAFLMTFFSGIMLFTSPSNNTKSNVKKELIEHSIDEDLAEMILHDMDDTTEQKNSSWFSLFLFITPYLICTLYFNYESNLIKNKLNTILKV